MSSLKFSFGALIFGMAASAVLACSPLPPKKFGFKFFFDQAATDPTFKMFIGRVITVEELAPTQGHLSDQKVRFQVIEAFSEPRDEATWVYTYVDDPRYNTCPPRPTVTGGQIWLIVGQQQGDMVMPFGLVANELLPEGVLPAETVELLKANR